MCFEVYFTLSKSKSAPQNITTAVGWYTIVACIVSENAMCKSLKSNLIQAAGQRVRAAAHHRRRWPVHLHQLRYKQHALSNP